MNFDKSKRTGLCYRCGKSIKGYNHENCGAPDADAEKKEKLRLNAGRSVKKRYGKGDTRPWMYL